MDKDTKRKSIQNSVQLSYAFKIVLDNYFNLRSTLNHFGEFHIENKEINFGDYKRLESELERELKILH